ncbi:MAG: hypothetical protein WA667_30690 [Candidatus Nitrosopolaris sp.]
MTEEGSKSDIASAFDYFKLDSSYIDTNIVASICINRDINAIIVDVNKNLISASIHLEEFSEKTIKPLKRDLTQLLKDNKNKQAIFCSGSWQGFKVIVHCSCSCHREKRIESEEVSSQISDTNRNHVSFGEDIP